MTIRDKRILHSIQLTKGEGLEIGPLSAPIVRKEQAKVYYLDHISREGLLEKYKADPIDPNDIVDVDYILKGNLEQTVKGKKFDYVIAAHVIEHVPNMAKWLQEVAEALKPGGVLSLVIPDKRFTFDIQRNETTASEIVGRYIDGVTKHSSSTIYDFYSNYVDNVDTAKAWDDPEFYKRAKSRWSAEEAYELCETSAHKKGYVDCHCSVFTPQSFVAILRELIQQGLFDYKVGHFVKTQPYELEFYVSLIKLPSKSKDKKAQLASLPKIRASATKGLENEQAEEIARLKQELAAITQSTSWRVTAPIRKAKKISSKLQQKD
jgi:SAM-dependent methyltransferase